jgi:hypothetical protein
MSIQSAEQFHFGFWQGRSVEIEEVTENLTTDGGLIAFEQLDQRLGWLTSFSELIDDQRRSCEHTIESVVRQRVYGILAGYEDQNDHDTLRSDPMFKLLAGRLPEGDDLASQPTISRIENIVTACDLLRLEEWFIDRFVESFDEAPTQLTLDIDTFDDPTHGHQQLTFFHGFYNQYQYQVRAITCAENDMVVLPVLLHGSAHVSLGAGEDLVRVIEALRRRYPDVKIHVRADSGFAMPRIYELLEQLPEVFYSIGYSMNPTVKRLSNELLEQTEALYEEKQQAQRAFAHFEYQAGSWSRTRQLIVKCEVQAQGTNRRAVLTNRPGAAICPAGTYDEYADRGESENRNKELKCELAADRLSDHRYMANLFRIMMHTLAANMLVQLRRLVVDPPISAPAEEIPPEAQSPSLKRKRHNNRRRRNPLGEGHACTWRTLIIKVAARVIVSSRRVRILISSSWPYANYLRKVSQALAALPPPAPSG